MLDRRQEETRDIAARTLAALARHELQPTPEAYKVWFTFLADSNPDLTALMRGLLERGEPIDDARCQELFERFFGSVREERQLQRAGLRLSELTQQLIQEVGGIGEGAARYGSVLSEARDGVSRSSSVEEVGRLLGSIVDETARMQEHVQRVEGLLLESATRIQDLRHDLQLAWREARTDGLTGLANRKHFDLAIRTAAAQSVEQGAPVCLVLADVDHFKSFNDQYGHAMGDHVLRLVASILRSNVKGKDLVARYGGEEFAVILPATQPVDAVSLANQLRETVASRQILLRQSGRSLGRVTMSFGVTAYVAGEPVTAWIDRADDALYQAKRAGRNRVMASTGAAAPATELREVAMAEA
jgi:diguanylate cyclase